MKRGFLFHAVIRESISGLLLLIVYRGVGRGRAVTLGAIREVLKRRSSVSVLLACDLAAMIQCVLGHLFLQLDVQSVNFILANELCARNYRRRDAARTADETQRVALRSGGSG